MLQHVYGFKDPILNFLIKFRHVWLNNNASKVIIEYSKNWPGGRRGRASARPRRLSQRGRLHPLVNHRYFYGRRLIAGFLLHGNLSQLSWLVLRTMGILRT